MQANKNENKRFLINKRGYVNIIIYIKKWVLKIILKKLLKKTLESITKNKLWIL